MLLNHVFQHIAFSLLLLGVTTPSFTLRFDKQTEEHRKREIPSPETNAHRILRDLKEEFNLSEKKYDSIY